MFGKRKDLEFRDLVITYKRVFGSPEGKIVLYDLMSRYHVINAHDGSKRSEGQRDVVIEIMKKCNIDMKALDELLKGENS